MSVIRIDYGPTIAATVRSTYRHTINNCYKGHVGLKYEKQSHKYVVINLHKCKYNYQLSQPKKYKITISTYNFDNIIYVYIQTIPFTTPSDGVVIIFALYAFTIITLPAVLFWSILIPFTHYWPFITFPSIAFNYMAMRLDHIGHHVIKCHLESLKG